MDNGTCLSPYVANQPYTSGPWRCHDPEPMSSLQLMDLHPIEAPPHELPPSHLVCPNFFKSAPKLRTSSNGDMSDWDYSMRRKAQEILPFLYLGPLSTARDINFLHKKGITLLLAIRTRHFSHSLMINADKTAAALGIESDHIDASDFQELIGVFPNAVRRINDHLCRCPSHLQPNQLTTIRSNKKVLVFCETGNERSAAIVVAYLMAMLHVNPSEALANVQARRLCVNIDAHARNFLSSFGTILEAQKDVIKAQQNGCDVHLSVDGLTKGTSPRKRSFEDDKESKQIDGDDMEVDSPADMDGNPIRIPQAPFRDIQAS